MRLLSTVLLFAALPVFSADRDFNGRWDITVPGEQRVRAWWLEVTGVDTASPKGRFVGAPGGQMDDVQEIGVRDGELRFTIVKKPSGPKGQGFTGTYTARLVDGQLQGSFLQRGEMKLKWFGKRAPVITEKDDGTWREGKPIPLFNGKDLSGWAPIVPGRPLGWAVKDGIMSNQGGANNLATVQKFWNFILHLEFRLGENSNSGIGLRSRYEVQIMSDHGRPIDGHSSGTIYGRILPTVNATKPAGEWQTYDIRLVGRQVTVVYNGIKVIDKKEIEGLTAIATDPNEGEPGALSLQGDHGPVDIRSIVLTPLVK